MIGYDIDGVLLHDVKWEKEQDQKLKKYRDTVSKPTFVPSGEYVLITGRPAEDKAGTMKWVEQEFAFNPPKAVYVENPDFRRASDYKIKVLKEHPEITAFIESNYDQYKLIKEALPDRNIIWYTTLIKSAIEAVTE